MSSADERIALAKAGVERFAAGDIEGFLATLDPGVEIFSTPELPNHGTFSGREGWIEWTTTWFDAWDDFRIEVEDYEAVGQRHVLVKAIQRATGVGSGVPVEMRCVYMSDYVDGLVSRFHLYADRDSALVAVQAGESRSS